MLFLAADNLFGHTKHSLMSDAKPTIRCLKCSTEWDMQEIAKKADLTADETCFFEVKMSLNFINQGRGETSSCPSCGSFCQRQRNSLQPTRCIVCTKKNKKVYDFCWSCKSEWTSNHVCKDRLKEIQEILNKASLKEMRYSGIKDVPSKRVCPGCKILIEHEKDCKTMACKECKTVFCFSCLKIAKYGEVLPCGKYNEICAVAPIQNVL